LSPTRRQERQQQRREKEKRRCDPTCEIQNEGNDDGVKNELWHYGARFQTPYDEEYARSEQNGHKKGVNDGKHAMGDGFWSLPDIYPYGGGNDDSDDAEKKAVKL